MKKGIILAMLVGFAGVVAMAEDAAAPAAEKPAPKASCFACAKCDKSVTKVGKCCGSDLKACHVLSVKDGVTTCCGCAPDCADCGEVKDGKCACGKAVKTCKATKAKAKPKAE